MKTQKKQEIAAIVFLGVMIILNLAAIVALVVQNAQPAIDANMRQLGVMW